MSRHVNYTERYTNVAERQDRALEDLKEWLTEETYYKIAEQLSNLEDTSANREFIIMTIGMAGGATGYPVEVFVNRFIGCNNEINNSL